jgi:hypothetical protein
VDRPAPGTFATKTDAERWLARTEVEIHDDRGLTWDLKWWAVQDLNL